MYRTVCMHCTIRNSTAQNCSYCFNEIEVRVFHTLLLCSCTSIATVISDCLYDLFLVAVMIKRWYHSLSAESPARLISRR